MSLYKMSYYPAQNLRLKNKSRKRFVLLCNKNQVILAANPDETKLKTEVDKVDIDKLRIFLANISELSNLVSRIKDHLILKLGIPITESFYAEFNAYRFRRRGDKTFLFSHVTSCNYKITGFSDLANECLSK